MGSFVNIMLLSAALQMLADPALLKLPWLKLAIATPPVMAQNDTTDPIAESATRTHINTLRQAGYSEAAQGIWLQTHDGRLLANRQATRLLPVASLTKSVTTLAALQTWKPDYRFYTLVGTTGRLQGDVLLGDLIVQGAGDPFMVWEEAIALGNALNRLGIKRVQGNLIVTGAFYMNFESGAKLSSNLFRQAINAGSWSSEIAAQYAAMPPGTPRPNLKISGASLVGTTPAGMRSLIRHASLPLWQILKRMNTFSNNAMAEMMAGSLGGAGIIMRQAIAATGLPANEINLINGSGLGQQNQISPRGIVAVMMAIQNRAQTYGLSLADLFPSSDCGCGTIEGRKLPPGSIVKTGTLSDVSTLTGVIQTRDRGAIWFAIINRGLGDIDFFHGAQDRLLQDLVQKWGIVGRSKTPISLTLLPSLTPVPWQDSDRNEILATP